MLPVLIGVTVLCFILMTASGKDPALAVAMRSNSAGDTALIASLREEMGLDEPLPARYFLWLKGLLTGDMGKSVVTYHSITDDIKSFFPVTFRLVIMAMGWMILIVFPISMLCARFHNKMFDHIVRLLTIGGICLPVFWLGFMLLLLFAVRLQIFSVAPKAGIKGSSGSRRQGLPCKRIYTSVVCPGVSVSLRSNQGNAFIPAFRNKLGLCSIRTDKRAVRMADNRKARI